LITNTKQTYMLIQHPVQGHGGAVK